jgi:hypothetical protein
MAGFKVITEVAFFLFLTRLKRNCPFGSCLDTPNPFLVLAVVIVATASVYAIFARALPAARSQ